ncbi:MAG: radical SAM protein [Elusimicrobia bacterium]|nr:radical SAM protein [Elusimicrobiota bacterium]
MYDRFKRRIDYLRVSVTDRCNLRCAYCMPPGGGRLVDRKDILSFEEIAAFAARAAELGVDKIRLTGGEPLMRRGIAQLVALLAAIPGIRDLSMTTNAILLPRHAADLRRSGLRRVNVSLDTLDPGRFRALTRGGELSEVLAGIAAAQEAGFAPIKVNCVVKAGPEEPDAQEVARFCAERGLQARFIPEMDMAAGRFGVVTGGSGGDCGRCNRLRLTSDGYLKPCLFSDVAFPVRSADAGEVLRQAVAAKPECGTASRTHGFYSIGG